MRIAVGDTDDGWFAFAASEMTGVLLRGVGGVIF